ncbi:MAG: metallophosphoesterase [Deltaproteobacteria bacterium]|nr:metallophosphoesterase [Deltaproteobacteria bacterium]
MRYIHFLTITVGVLSIIYSYIGWRLISPAMMNPVWKRIAWATIPFFIFMPFVPFFFRFRGIENNWTDLLSWIAYLSLGFFSILFTLLIARDSIWLVIFLGKKILSLFSFSHLSNPMLGGTVDPVKRQFMVHIINSGIMGLAVLLTIYGLFEANRRPSVKEISIPIQGLHKDLDGFTIAQITDIHVGPTIKQGFVKKVVERVHGLKPDVIALTGDIADGSVKRLKDDVAPLGDLSAPHGIFFVTGNHEYYSDAEAWVAEMKRMGFTVLMNENKVIMKGNGTLVMAGIPDLHASRFAGHPSPDAEKALLGAKQHPVKILLAHQPRSILDAAKAGFDLQISGHTHGGQFFPWIYIVKKAHPYTSNLHKHGKTWIYVSHGAGYWGPPIRLGVPSEITLIRLATPNSATS